MMRNDDQRFGVTAAAAGAPAPATVAGGAPELARRYDVALLDLDGVVYSGPAAVPGAVAALAAARAAGMRLAFVTNNASRTPAAIAAQLSRLGVPAAAGDVVTSAQAAATLIADRFPPGSPVLVAGGMGLRQALHARGLRPVSTVAERPVAVVQGFSPDLNYGLLAEAALAVRGGALFVASNTDATLPTPRGPQPGNGTMVGVIVAATGIEPVVAGKPEPPLHAESVQRTGARRPLVVGDRLDTDIAGAVRGGADSLLVLTGVSRPLDVVLAPPPCRPTYLAADLGGLLEPGRAVGPADGGGANAGGEASDRGGAGDGGRGADDAASAGGWTVTRADGTGLLRLAGDGDPIDGLRAICALAWSAAAGDAGAAGRAGPGGSAQPVTAAMVEPALRELGLLG